MKEEEITELISIIKGFQELVSGDDIADYVHSCECCGTYFTDDFDKKRKELRRRAGRFFEVEEEKWRWD